MLDTRKITDFIHPENCVKKCNELLPDEKFSDWDNNSTNFVLSHLLREHILNVVTDEKNYQKLKDTYRKLGLPAAGRKILMIDSTTGIMMMYEIMDNNSVLTSCCMNEPNGDFILLVSTSLHFLSPDCKPGNIFISGDVFIDKRYDGLMSDSAGKKYFGDVIARAAAMFIYLTLIEIETVFVQPKEKFKPKKYEGFKNMQKVPIQVADLSWSREVVNNIPFGVVGHLRNQPVGPGRKDRKLIYIEPFMKQGLVRKSGKERILKS